MYTVSEEKRLSYAVRVPVDNETKNMIIAEADRREMSMSQLCRRAIKEWLELHGQKEESK